MLERQAMGWVVLREGLEGRGGKQIPIFPSKNSIEYAKNTSKSSLKIIKVALEMWGQNPRGSAEMVACGYLGQTEAWGKGICDISSNGGMMDFAEL